MLNVTMIWSDGGYTAEQVDETLTMEALTALAVRWAGDWLHNRSGKRVPKRLFVGGPNGCSEYVLHLPTGLANAPELQRVASVETR